MQDTVQRVARMEGQVDAIKVDLHDHLKNCEGAHKEIQARFRTIEKMLWTALGGLTVIGGLIAMYGHNIMKVLVG